MQSHTKTMVRHLEVDDKFLTCMKSEVGQSYRWSWFGRSCWSWSQFDLDVVTTTGRGHNKIKHYCFLFLNVVILSWPQSMTNFGIDARDKPQKLFSRLLSSIGSQTKFVNFFASDDPLPVFPLIIKNTLYA